jgi:hypothetical protein
MENKPDTQLPVEREAAKWNPNDKERDATTYAGIVVALMGSAIKNLSTGCNYDAIELDVRSSIYYFQKLVEIILPAEQAIPLHQLQQENAELHRWKMEAAELLTKIHSYAHKHLEIKLGESTVEFVIERAKERDEFKLCNDRLKIALENVYRIHGAQWSEYDRNVIKDLIK